MYYYYNYTLLLYNVYTYTSAIVVCCLASREANISEVRGNWLRWAAIAGGTVTVEGLGTCVSTLLVIIGLPGIEGKGMWGGREREGREGGRKEGREKEPLIEFMLTEGSGWNG